MAPVVLSGSESGERLSQRRVIAAWVPVCRSAVVLLSHVYASAAITETPTRA